MNRGGVLFGSVFSLAGLVVLYFIVISPIIDASKMQFWHSTQGQLTSADVNSFQSRNDDGGYTTMYKVVIQYQYNVAGNQYYGNRATIRNDNSSSDSGDAYKLLSKVKYEQRSKNGITLWYNPNNVNQSIYDRTLNVKFLLMMTLFSGVFITIGLGVIFYSRSKQPPKTITVASEKPWEALPQWASPIIYSNAKTSVKYAWYFALLSGMFFGMFSLALFGQHPVATAFALLFLIAPMWLVIRAVRMQKEWKYFNKAPLKLSTYPGVIGGIIKGRLAIPGKTSTSEKYTVTLHCTKYWTKRSGSKTESSQSIIFSKEQVAIARPSANEANIDFNFDIPADKPQSSVPSNSYYKWTIAVKGKLNTFNFNREYEVPVFITKNSMTVEDELVEKPLTSSEKLAMKDRLAINVSTVKGEMKLHTPGSKSSLFIAAIGAIFFIVGVLIYTLNGAFFGIVFSAFSCVFLGLGIWGYGRNCKIIVKLNCLQVDVFFFSKHIKQQLFSLGEVSRIEAFSSSTMHTNGKQTSEKFALRLFTALGTSIDLGGDFNSMKNAIHMKQKIEQIFGVVDDESKLEV